MALTTPILLSQVAFDATQNQQVKFNSIGGSQVTGNRLKIINNTTGITVYNQLQTTYQSFHTIPANTLTNGTYYAMQIQTTDAQGNLSTWSNTVQFYCYTTPQLVFANIPVGNIINNSNFTFEATYTQLEGESLNSYVYNLYNTSDVLLSSSGTQYVGSTTTPPNTLYYTFNGFEDNVSYKIEINGITINGTSVTSGLITITADYVQPSIFALLQLSNNCDGGYINIVSNIINIEGTSNPDPPIYIDNEKVDLISDSIWVLWNSGFNINGNFTLGIWGEQFTEQSTINILSNNQNTTTTPNNIKINYRKDYQNSTATQMSIFAELYCYNNFSTPYYCFSNYIPIPANNEQIFIWVRRINNIFQIQIENRGVIV